MRVFTSGNSDLCNWHLPVIKAQVAAWVERIKRRGLVQGVTSFVFQEDGTNYIAQYSFGMVSVQVYAPSKSSETDESRESTETEVLPKVFFINTTKGYFWVEVRIGDDGPTVILTQFDETPYPGVELAAPGMISGTLTDSSESRYVLAQSAGMIRKENGLPGQVWKIADVSVGARISVIGDHDYVVAHNAGGQYLDIVHVRVSYEDGLQVSVLKQQLEMLFAPDNGLLHVSMLHQNPCWIHRKCTANYFSPNKTIGYHVDIGSDDDYFGNAYAIAPGMQNRQDNTGGIEEFLFNHTPDLYRIASILSMPISVEEEKLTFFVVTPTMVFDDDSYASKKCWGGYWWRVVDSCSEYMADGDRWILAPRIVRVTIDMSSGDVQFEDYVEADESYDILMWDGSQQGSIVYEREYECGSSEYFDGNTTEVVDCSWLDEADSLCTSGESSGQSVYASNWSISMYKRRFTREDIINKRRLYFLLGIESPNPSDPGVLNGYFFFFDGLFHLDVGVQWSTDEVSGTGENCTLCANPPTGQVPGGTVAFRVMSPTHDLMVNGVEFVDNLEITSPLGWQPGLSPWYGFIAKVPQELEDLHTPVMLTGGVRFVADSIDGRTMECSASLMSQPCTCTTMEAMEEYSTISTFQVKSIILTGGCPPYRWTAANGRLGYYAGSDPTYVGIEYIGPMPSMTFFPDDQACFVTLHVQDACGESLSFNDSMASDVLTVSGPSVLSSGESGTWVISSTIGNYDGVELVSDGGLELVSGSGSGWIFRVPAGGTGTYTIEWIASCGRGCSATVTSMYDEEGYCMYPQCGSVLPQTGDIVSMASPACRPTWPKQCQVVGVWVRLTSNCRAGTALAACCAGLDWWGPIYNAYHLIATDLIDECREWTGFYDHVASLTPYTG